MQGSQERLLLEGGACTCSGQKEGLTAGPASQLMVATDKAREEELSCPRPNFIHEGVNLAGYVPPARGHTAGKVPKPGVCDPKARCGDHTPVSVS